jgi:hypothetical protein
MGSSTTHKIKKTIKDLLKKHKNKQLIQKNSTKTCILYFFKKSYYLKPVTIKYQQNNLKTKV